MLRPGVPPTQTKREKNPHPALLNEPLFLGVLRKEHTPTPSQVPHCGAEPPPPPPRGTNSEGGWTGCWAGRSRGLLGPGGLHGEAGGRPHASHATRATILSGNRDYFTPAAKGEAEQDRAVIPTGAPTRGPDPATGPTPSPRDPAMVAAPQGHPPPQQEQSQRKAAPKTAPSPRGGRRGQAGATGDSARRVEPPNKNHNALHPDGGETPGRAAGRGQPGAGGSFRAPLRDGSFVWARPRRSPLPAPSRTHHGIFSSYIFSILALKISLCPPPEPPAICLISLP